MEEARTWICVDIFHGFLQFMFQMNLNLIENRPDCAGCRPDCAYTFMKKKFIFPRIRPLAWASRLHGFTCITVWLATIKYENLISDICYSISYQNTEINYTIIC